MPANIYWYDNNWHYIRKWDHLKNSVALNSYTAALKEKLLHHANKDFTASDLVMCKCISTAISLLWSDDQIKEKGEKIVSVVKKVLSETAVHVN